MADRVVQFVAAVQFNMASQRGKMYRSKLPSSQPSGEEEGSDLILQAAHRHRMESPTPTQSNVVMPVSLKRAYNVVVPSSETKNAKGKLPPKLYIVQ